MSPELHIVTLCSGNVARSVMLSAMLEVLGEHAGETWQLRSAGTHVVEGSSISARTLMALRSIDELGDRHYGSHRSHQVNDEDLEWATIVLASEADHVNYVRRHFPADAHKAVLFGQFVRRASLDVSFSQMCASIAALAPDPTFDVIDPAGGDDATYVACARELWELAQAFTVLATAN